MYIAYYDESGDDGYPTFSSPLFVLSVVYLHYLNWKEVNEKLTQFRRQIKTDFNIPVKMEFKTRYFLLNKNPYRSLNLSVSDRLLIIDLFCDLIAQLDFKIINVVINKNNISSEDYEVLHNALTYSIQRIENDLKKIDPANRFMIITDEGRVGKMRRTSRKIQRINFIPSKFGGTYRKEIEALIEDPLPKNSNESYFIQTADLVSYIVYLYTIDEYTSGNFHGRLPEEINSEKIREWMDKIKHSLNVETSTTDDFGVVVYPR